jgi:hypothetical protein
MQRTISKRKGCFTGSYGRIRGVDKMKRWQKNTVYVCENNNWTKTENNFENYYGKIHILIEPIPGTRKEIYAVWLNDDNKNIHTSYDKVTKNDVDKIMNNYIVYGGYYYGLTEIKNPECYQILPANGELK